MAVNKRINKNGSVTFVADVWEGKKRFRKSFTTEAEASKWEKVRLAEIAKGEFIAPSTETMRELAAEWIARKRAMKKADGKTTAYKESSLQYWEYHVNSFINPVFGDMKVSQANDVLTIERGAATWKISP